MEGRWVGPLPLAEGTSCVTKIFENSRFEVLCSGENPQTPEWAGDGMSSFDGKTLVLDFRRLAHRGEGSKRPAPLKFQVRGRGNEADVVPEGETEAVTWRREFK